MLRSGKEVESSRKRKERREEEEAEKGVETETDKLVEAVLLAAARFLLDATRDPSPKASPSQTTL